jgi:hydrogenase-4 component F
MLVDGARRGRTRHPALAGHLLMGFGLVSFMVAGLFLHRQRDIKRMFSYSSIEHMGLMTFAFGLGGPLATFGALLHMLVHSLTKSAIFVTVGHASQIAGTQRHRQHPRPDPHPAGGRLVAADRHVAIAGFPPFGVFTSEFLLLTATMQSWPWLTVALLAGWRSPSPGCSGICSRWSTGRRRKARSRSRPTCCPCSSISGLVLWLGLSMPGFLADWLDRATELITGGRLL